MAMFEDRQKGFEAKFAKDAETDFRITARRNRLLGVWVGNQLGLTDVETEAYAKSVVQADFEEKGDDDVVRKLMGDLLKGGFEVSEITIREALSRMDVEARRQIEAEG